MCPKRQQHPAAPQTQQQMPLAAAISGTAANQDDENWDDEIEVRRLARSLASHNLSR